MANKFEEFHTNCRYLYGPKFLRGPELPIFSCGDDSFLVSLYNINLDTKYLKEDEASQKRAPILFFGNDFQIGISSLEL